MSETIYWNREDSTLEGKEKFKRIADWWIELKGKQVNLFTIQGNLIAPSGEVTLMRHEAELFIVQNPRLEDTALSYVKEGQPWKLDVLKLEMNIQKPELKVFFSKDFPHNYQVFTPSSSGAYFKIE